MKHRKQRGPSLTSTKALCCTSRGSQPTQGREKAGEWLLWGRQGDGKERMETNVFQSCHLIDVNKRIMGLIKSGSFSSCFHLIVEYASVTDRTESDARRLEWIFEVNFC